MKVLQVLKAVAKHELVKSANSTTSLHSYQPTAPKSLKNYKK